MTERLVYLLDLNYTLVENSNDKRSPFTVQIANERYRTWLVDLLRDQTVFLITARPVQYAAQTMERIFDTTGWRPQRHFFNTRFQPPAQAKRYWLDTVILNEYQPGELYGIESNPSTRSMYLHYGIQSQPIGASPWTTLPKPK